MTRLILVVVSVLGSRVASADLANNEAIHEHVDTMLGRLDAAGLAEAKRHAPLADRWSLTVGALLPIYGTYELDRSVFGGVRPSAVVFDWILGGVVPAGLGITALATGGSLSLRTREILGWSAIGLYASTRIGVLIIGNLHVSEYNRYIKLRLGVAEAPSGRLAPTLLAGTTW